MLTSRAGPLMNQQGYYGFLQALGLSGEYITIPQDVSTNASLIVAQHEPIQGIY